MRQNLVAAILAATLTTACSRQPTEAEKHMQEDYEIYHKKLAAEQAEAAYRKTPAYKAAVRRKQAAEDAAWKRYAASITKTAPVVPQ